MRKDDEESGVCFKVCEASLLLATQLPGSERRLKEDSASEAPANLEHAPIQYYETSRPIGFEKTLETKDILDCGVDVGDFHHFYQELPNGGLQDLYKWLPKDSEMALNGMKDSSI